MVKNNGTINLERGGKLHGIVWKEKGDGSNDVTILWF